ncbi:hypothetical protein Lal_00027341 [Lupinus albus]|nr:hypothetical protein Lal_00027341 [Lupinus albus]
MATLDSALSLTLFASHRFSNNHRYSPKPHDSIKFHPSLHNNLFFSSKSLSFSTSTSLCFQLCSALQEAPPPTSEEKTEQNQTKTTNLKTKLFVFNLPWTLSAVDIKELFAQCGNVTDVEIIKSKDGRSKGFCFVTMATGEEAMDAVNKFDSYKSLNVSFKLEGELDATIRLLPRDVKIMSSNLGNGLSTCWGRVRSSTLPRWPYPTLVGALSTGLPFFNVSLKFCMLTILLTKNCLIQEISGRILRVEFSKRFKKPSPARPPGPPLGETRHVIFATNVAWKARSTHFRDFITENFKQPVSARVVFDSPTGRSAGYAFASFLTKEDAEAAISALDGKELMGRPLHLKFSERKVKEAGSKQDDNNTQLEDSADDAQLEEDTDDAQPEDNTDDTQLEDDNDDAQPEDDQLIES